MTDHKLLLRIVSETFGEDVVCNVVVSKVELLAEQLANCIAKLIRRHTISDAKVVWED
jgi:hypothetical protein